MPLNHFRSIANLSGTASLNFITLILLALLGVFSGFLGGLLGVGGGIIIVPILILVFDLQANQAVGTSLVMIIFTALSATFAYQRQKRLDWKVGIMGASVTVPGAAIGAYATSFFSSEVLTIILGIFLFFIAAFMSDDHTAQETRKRKRELKAGVGPGDWSGIERSSMRMEAYSSTTQTCFQG